MILYGFSSLFVDGAEHYVNKFLEVKYQVIGNIVDKKNKSGDLIGYTKADWQRDFRRAIDCRDLRLKSEPDKKTGIHPTTIKSNSGGNTDK